MEEDDELLSNINNASSTATSKTLDPAAQKKHAAMLERLSRKSHHHKPDSESPSSNPPFESTQSFLSRLTESKLSIESRLSLVRHNPIPESKSELESISDSISDLEKVVAENSYFLPSYEVRSCLKTISDLKQTLDIISSEVVPRKKFSFKNKSTKKTSTINSFVDETHIDNRNVVSRNPNSKAWDSPGFRVAENKVLVKEFNDEEICEFTLSDLIGCEVRLMGRLRALFLHKLKDCKVYVGPVSSSILIEEVEDCVFIMASHQIRIHHAKRCDFYLRVRSRPIIEDSNAVRFAPYSLNYREIEKDLEEANLGEETGNWANVDDFRWLRAVQSPNWSVLPESERISTEVGVHLHVFARPALGVPNPWSKHTSIGIAISLFVDHGTGDTCLPDLVVCTTRLTAGIGTELDDGCSIIGVTIVSPADDWQPVPNRSA